MPGERPAVVPSKQPAAPPRVPGLSLLLAVHTWPEVRVTVQVWSVAVALYLVGTVVWNLFATGEKVFD